jgi:hypothetical protein
MHTPVFAFVSSKRYTIHVSDAFLIREICISKRRSFPKAVHLYDRVSMFGPNIVTTEGGVWRRHRLVARAAFNEASNRLVFETVKECVAGMAAAWERQRERGGEEEFRVTVMEDIAQVTLAIVAQASFGLEVEAVYGKEREEKEKEEKGGRKEGAKEGGGGDGRYTMSFTKCMEIVSQNTLVKVSAEGRGREEARGEGVGSFLLPALASPFTLDWTLSSTFSNPFPFQFGHALTLPSFPPSLRSSSPAGYSPCPSFLASKRSTGLTRNSIVTCWTSSSASGEEQEGGGEGW